MSKVEKIKIRLVNRLKICPCFVSGTLCHEMCSVVLHQTDKAKLTLLTRPPLTVRNEVKGA